MQHCDQEILKVKIIVIESWEGFPAIYWLYCPDLGILLFY